MLKQLTGRTDIVLTGAFFIFLVIAYQLAFKKTIAAWQEHTELNKQIVTNTDMNYDPDYLGRKNANLTRIINRLKADSVSFRSNIISTIAIVANRQNIKLAEVPVQDTTDVSNRFLMEKLVFEGDYFSMLKTLDQLQEVSNIGIIRSVEWRMVNNTAAGSGKKLIMEIYLEALK